MHMHMAHVWHVHGARRAYGAQVHANACTGALSQIGWGLGGGGTDNVEGIVLYVVVIFTCIITWLQDRAAANVLASIKGMLSTSSVVSSDGAQSSSSESSSSSSSESSSESSSLPPH